MILKINTINKDEITVEIDDKKSKKNITLVEKQKLGSQALVPLIASILKKTKMDFSRSQVLRGSYSICNQSIPLFSELYLREPGRGSKGNKHHGRPNSMGDQRNELGYFP